MGGWLGVAGVVGMLVGWVSWLVGRLVSWLVGRLVSWLVGRVGRLILRS